MPAADYAILAGAAVTPDPWVETGRLAAGRPAEITALAAAFARGSGEAQLAAELAEQGSQLTAQGYTNNGAPVHELDRHVAQSRSLLGDSGQTMRRVATILDAVADDLTTRTGRARTDLLFLEAELGRLQTAWNDYDQRYRQVMATNPSNGAELAAQHGAEWRKITGAAAETAGRYGRQIGESVKDYDWELGRRSRDLAGLGYAPPDDLAGGPGDVTGDPDAGARDGARLQELLAQPPSQQNMAEIDALTGDVRALADRAGAGERLTDAQRGYLTQFFDTLGADGLAALPEHLREGAPLAADLTRGADGLPVASADDVYRTTLAPFGDAILSLSRQTTADDGTTLRYEQQVPAAVRSLLDTPIGVTDPSTGARWANDRFLQPGDANPDRNNPSAHLLGGGVAGLSRYQGLVDVLGASNRAPGGALAGELVDSAVRTRQELNAVQHNARHHLDGTLGGGTDATVAELDRLVDDRASSDALSVAARNVDASSVALLDPPARAEMLAADAREPFLSPDARAALVDPSTGQARTGETQAAILGLNWEDAQGAADLVAAGTLRDPAAGGGGELQAAAGLGVVREVAGDRDGYLDRMSEPVQAAVTDVGRSYLDALAAPTVDESGVAEGRDALGRSLGPSFELSRADRDGFLQFVSGTGDDEAARFQADARLYSEAAVANVLVNGKGDAQALEVAVRDAGRLDGAITQAHYDHRLDGVNAEDERAAAAARAAAVEGRATQGDLNTGVAVLREVGGKLVGLAPGGGLIREFGSPLLAVVAEIGKGEIGNQTLPAAPLTPGLPQGIEDMGRQDSESANLQRDLLLARAAEAAGLFGPGETPLVLTQDNDGDGTVDPPTSTAQAQRQLSPAVGAVYGEWGVDNAQLDYSDERGTTMSGTYGGAGAPAESLWRDDPGFAYGSVPGPDPRFFSDRPDDARQLDDPLYDARRNEMRPR